MFRHFVNLKPQIWPGNHSRFGLNACMKSEKPEQSKLPLAMMLGGVMSSNILGGIVVGYVMDKWLGTSPWLIITGIVLGTIGALAGVYRITSRLNQ